MIKRKEKIKVGKDVDWACLHCGEGQYDEDVEDGDILICNDCGHEKDD